MRVTLCSVNASWTHSCLSLYILRTALLQTKHQVQIIELTLKHTYLEALEAICLSNPEVLCLSVYIWNADYFCDLIPSLRNLLPQTKLIIGGPEVTRYPDALIIYRADYLITGYGEKAFAELARHNFQSAEALIKGEPVNLADMPFPYQIADKPNLRNKLVYYESSRGCPMQCIYCLSSLDAYFAELPVDRVKQEIDIILSYQPKVIKFVDRTFNLHPVRARAIWQYVIDLQTTIPFHFEVRPDLLTQADIDLLASTPPGRIQLEAGIQSIHESTLLAIKRSGDWQTAQANLLALRTRTQIKIHADLIAGLPSETMSDILNSVDEVLLTHPHELQLGFLKILPGTAMEAMAQSEGYLWTDHPPYQVLSTPSLSFAELLILDKLVACLNLFWNKGDFLEVWTAVLRSISPTACLKAVLSLMQGKNIPLHSQDRITRFEVMSAWIEQNWQGDERSYLSDALKWDWCRNAGEPWFPSCLKAERSLAYRKEHYHALHRWLEKTCWQQEGWNTKRFIVFIASSSKFAEDYLDGYTTALFVSRPESENAVVINKERF